MEPGTQEERDVRAARNQALFRAVKEKLTSFNDERESANGTLVIACECADVGCIETVEIEREKYRAVRGEPRRFVVRAGHVYPDVECVVGEAEQYVVVEKTGVAAAVVEILEQKRNAGDV